MASRIPVEKLKAGMILGEPIMNKNKSKREGFSVGTRLSDSQVAAIKGSGISSVTVEEETGQPEANAEAFLRVKGRMHWVPSSPIEEEIYRVALQRAGDLLSKKEEE